MTKTLKHYKRQHSRTRRLRKGSKGRKVHKGGRAYRSEGDFDLGQLKRLEDGQHLFAVHSSPTCKFCNDFEPEWEKVLESLPQHPNLKVAKFGPKETNFVNDKYYDKHDYGVNGVPTVVYYIVNKKAPIEYHGERTADKIIRWLTKTMKENGLEVTIKPKTDEDVEQPVSFEQPEEVPKSQGDEQLELGASSSESAPALAPPSSESTPESAPALEPASEESTSDSSAPTASSDSASESAPAVQADTMADAFPAAPLSPASIADTVSTKANELNDTLKSATESATTAVSSTVSDIGNKLTNLFSSSSAPAPTAQAPAQAQTSAQETTAPLNVPQVPSLVGGRRHTRRKHRKSKSTRKSKKSKKSRK